MTRRVRLRWRLRQMMSERGIYQTSELVPLLAEREVFLSRQYVHRLVTTPPQRINTDLLAALCDILVCTPNELLEVVAEAPPARKKKAAAGEGLDIGALRPIRAAVRRPHDPA
jgi:DNA-binding Xre family transcriptional regulator